MFSGNGINTSTGVITDTNTNTQLSDAQVRSKFTGGTNVSITAAGVISSTDTNTQVTNNNQISNGAGYRTSAQVNAAIATVVDSAPSALNTLNELAAALGDDSDFAGSVTTSLSGKLSTTGTAANSTLLGGIGLGAAARNNVANKVVRTDGNGYANFGWINTTSGTASGTLARIYCSQDSYLRYLTPSAFLSSMGIAAGATNVTNNSQIGNGRGYITSFTDTNTQLSDTYVIGLFTGGTNVSIASDGTISSTDTNTDTNTQRSDEEIRDVASAQWINGTNTTVVKSDSGNTIKINSVNTNTQRGIHDSPVNGATTTSISSNWAFDNVKTTVPTGAVFTDTNTNTQLSDAQVRSKFSAGSNVAITAAGVISSTDTNTDTNTQLSTAQVRAKFSGTGINTSTGVITDTNTNTQLSDAQVRSKFTGGTNVSINASGVISSTDTNTDTNTQLSDTYVIGLFTGGTNVSIASDGTISSTDTNTNTQNSAATTRGMFSGNGINTSTGVITDTNTNTQLTAAQVRSNFTGGTNVSINSSGVISSTDTNTDTNTTYSAGGGLTLSGTTFSHTDTSARSSINGSGRTYIQDITLDTYGHVTALATATETVVNTDTNTQLSDAQVRSKFTGGTNVSINSSGVISSTDTNTDTNTVDMGDGFKIANEDGEDQFTVTENEEIRFATGGATSIAFDDSTQKITITSTDNNTTYSIGNGGLTQINFTTSLYNKLNGIATGANQYVHPTGAGNTHIPTGGSAGQFLTYSSSGVARWAADNNTNTTYTADGNYGMTLSGTTFRLEDDRRRNSTGADIKTGNTHDYTFYDASHGIYWYTAGSQEMYLNNSGTLHVDGDVVAYSTSVSDERLKDNVTTIENSLDKIKALRGVEYDWNSGSRKGKHDLGLIAQEVEKVIPNIVHEHEQPFLNKDEEDNTLYKTVDYEKLTAVLIEGMKEQQIQIDSMKSEINELKGRL